MRGSSATNSAFLPGTTPATRQIPTRLVSWTSSPSSIGCAGSAGFLVGVASATASAAASDGCASGACACLPHAAAASAKATGRLARIDKDVTQLVLSGHRREESVVAVLRHGLAPGRPGGDPLGAAAMDVHRPPGAGRVDIVALARLETAVLIGVALGHLDVARLEERRIEEIAGLPRIVIGARDQPAEFLAAVAIGVDAVL